MIKRFIGDGTAHARVVNDENPTVSGIFDMVFFLNHELYEYHVTWPTHNLDQKIWDQLIAL